MQSPVPVLVNAVLVNLTVWPSPRTGSHPECRPFSSWNCWDWQA